MLLPLLWWDSWWTAGLFQVTWWVWLHLFLYWRLDSENFRHCQFYSIKFGATWVITWTGGAARFLLSCHPLLCCWEKREIASGHTAVQRFMTTVICSRRDGVKDISDTFKTIAYNDNMQVVWIFTECLYVYMYSVVLWGPNGPQWRWGTARHQPQRLRKALG